MPCHRPHRRRKPNGGYYRTGLRRNFLEAMRYGTLTHPDVYEGYALGIISRREYVRLCRKKHWKVKD
jgi:hypothetical protein